MILPKFSGDHPWPWSEAGDEAAAEAIFAAAYPAIYAHLKVFEDQGIDPETNKPIGLRHREDQGRFWWEVRPCAYCAAFDQPKIVYQEIQYHPAYALDTEGRYLNNKGFLIQSADPLLLERAVFERNRDSGAD